jgi:hypothetical protein
MLPIFLTEGKTPHLSISHHNQQRLSILSKQFDNEYRRRKRVEIISSELSQPLPNDDDNTNQRRLTHIISLVDNKKEDYVKPKGRYLLLFIVEPIVVGCLLFPIVVLFWDCGWNLVVIMLNSLNGFPLTYHLDGKNYTNNGVGDYSPQSLIIPYVIVEVFVLILYLGQDLLYDFLKRQHTLVEMILLKIHMLILASLYIVQWEMMWTILDQYIPQDWTFIMALSLISLFILIVVTGTLSDLVCSPFVAIYDSIEYCIRFECSLATEHVSIFLSKTKDIDR